MDEIISLPAVRERSIIINCGTRLTSSLAILSTLSYIDMPLLVIDCPTQKEKNEELTDYKFLQILQKQHNFDLIQMPLSTHGDTLDKLFKYLRAEHICLIDSDVEILNHDGIKLMRQFANDEKIFKKKDKIFGSGFVRPASKGLPPRDGWYHMERMWIPFTYLKTSIVRNIINKGYSFNIIKEYNDFYFNAKISRLVFNVLVKLKRKYPQSLYKLFNLFFIPFRRSFNGYKPSLIEYDTGSKIHETLCKKGYLFLGAPFYVSEYYCLHFIGVTRNLLHENEPVSSSIKSLESYIKTRLNEKYSFDFDTFNK